MLSNNKAHAQGIHDTLMLTKYKTKLLRYYVYGTEDSNHESRNESGIQRMKDNLFKLLDVYCILLKTDHVIRGLHCIDKEYNRMQLDRMRIPQYV